MTDMRALLNLITESKVLDEMPIQHFQTIGDFSKNSSFRSEDDRKILTNPKAVAKIHQKLGKCPYDFNFFFVNAPEARQHFEVGRVDAAWMEQNLPQSWKEIAPKVDENAINVVFTNNRGDERYPMTAWIIAHRLGHVLFRQGPATPSYRQNEIGGSFYEARRELDRMTAEIFQEVGIVASRSAMGRSDRNFDRYRRWLYQSIGTMKAAREGNLRNADEFLFEMLAQYMIAGKVTFNPIRSVQVGVNFGRKQERFFKAEEAAEIAEMIQGFGELMTHEMDGVLGRSCGNLYVM